MDRDAVAKVAQQCNMFVFLLFWYGNGSDLTLPTARGILQFSLKSNQTICSSVFWLLI